jgi:3-dehydroquinate synthase
MQTITLKTDARASRILIGESLANLHKYIPQGKVIIITDDNINKYYRQSFPSVPVISIGLGENHKTMESLVTIFDKLVEFEADRSTFIVAIGGGIVCDVAGFAASIYMRGLRYGFVSTTLLSQVDASVGGKNGVNFRGYKNMIGVFNQPEFVVADIDMLKTLNDREYKSGFAEIVKAAAIKSESLFNFIEENYSAALAKDPSVMEKLIYESVLIKARVVEEDEKESGERKKLNFGHTFAHAIEHLTGMLHGEAVSIGMMLSASLAVEIGLLGKTEFSRLERLLRNLDLPVKTDTDYAALVSAMKKDKKRQGDNINMIFINHIGNALIKSISIKELENKKYDLRQY